MSLHDIPSINNDDTMTDGQKLAAAIAHLEEADALIQSVFAGSNELYDIYDRICRVIDDVTGMAEDDEIEIPPSA